MPAASASAASAAPAASAAAAIDLCDSTDESAGSESDSESGAAAAFGSSSVSDGLKITDKVTLSKNASVAASNGPLSRGEQGVIVAVDEGDDEPYQVSPLGEGGQAGEETWWYQSGDLVRAAAPTELVKVKGEGERSGSVKVKSEGGKLKRVNQSAVEDDEDCSIEQRPAKRVSTAMTPLGSPADDDDDDVQVTGMDDPTMAFAHARHNCRVPGMKFLNAAAPAASASAKLVQNAKHCEHCFCFVCDAPAKDCKDWGNHCMAEDSERWMNMRKEIKDSGGAAAAAFGAGDPFLSKLPKQKEPIMRRAPPGFKPALGVSFAGGADSWPRLVGHIDFIVPRCIMVGTHAICRCLQFLAPVLRDSL